MICTETGITCRHSSTLGKSLTPNIGERYLRPNPHSLEPLAPQMRADLQRGNFELK